MPYKDPAANREWQRKWIAKRRADYFEGKRCEGCGSTDRLELDHKDPKSKVDHRIWSWAQARREAELTKCQVLCHPCHVSKTIERDIHRTGHGCGQMYQKYKCRCVACRAWKAEGDKRYKATAKAKKLKESELARCRDRLESESCP